MASKPPPSKSTHRKDRFKAEHSSAAKSPRRSTRTVQITRSSKPDIAGIRDRFGLSRRHFARLCGYSERSLAEWEAGGSLSDSSRQRMMEMDRLRKGLSRIMQPDFIGEWLRTPNREFGGLKPLEVVERGELDLLWRMIYLLESGQPD